MRPGDLKPISTFDAINIHIWQHRPTSLVGWHGNWSKGMKLSTEFLSGTAPDFSIMGGRRCASSFFRRATFQPGIWPRAASSLLVNGGGPAVGAPRRSPRGRGAPVAAALRLLAAVFLEARRVPFFGLAARRASLAVSSAQDGGQLEARCPHELDRPTMRRGAWRPALPPSRLCGRCGLA